MTEVKTDSGINVDDIFMGVETPRNETGLISLIWDSYSDFRLDSNKEGINNLK